MTEPKFIIEFTVENNITNIAFGNSEAIELFNEVIKEVPNEPFIKFILLSPNSMDMDSNGYLVYEVDTTYKEDVIRELKSIKE